jgi:hypothetical protein
MKVKPPRELPRASCQQSLSPPDRLIGRRRDRHPTPHDITAASSCVRLCAGTFLSCLCTVAGTYICVGLWSGCSTKPSQHPATVTSPFTCLLAACLQEPATGSLLFGVLTRQIVAKRHTHKSTPCSGRVEGISRVGFIPMRHGLPHRRSRPCLYRRSTKGSTASPRPPYVLG